MLFVKTSDVARWCGVDHKTVNRWASTGKLPEGPRTPGGHRRFAPSVVLTFLKQHDYPVPDEVTDAVNAKPRTRGA